MATVEKMSKETDNLVNLITGMKKEFYTGYVSKDDLAERVQELEHMISDTYISE